MALFDAVRGPSLSFVSDGETYKLVRPWTNQDVLAILDSPLYIRKMLTEKSYAKWRKKHSSSDQAAKLTKDSLSTLGVPGTAVYDLLAVLNDDRLFNLLEADLLNFGITLESITDGTVPMRRVVSVFMSLPDSCAYKMKLNDPYSSWSTADYMLAEIADLLNAQVQLQHIHAQVSGWKPKSSFKFPKPIFKRPEEPKKPKMSKTSELISFLKADKVEEDDTEAKMWTPEMIEKRKREIYG